MKVLFTWIHLEKDLTGKGEPRNPKTGIINGPTLQLLELYKFDRVHLFAIANDKVSERKSRAIRNCVSDYPRYFGKPEMATHYIKILHAADYTSLWDEVPKQTKKILEAEEYKSEDTKFFFNVTSGSPAMITTWFFMVGTSEFDATLISPQLDPNINKAYLEVVDAGVYPHINKLKDDIQNTLDIVKKYKSDQMRNIYKDLKILASGAALKNRPILLLGEIGTGKTSIAKQFHEMTGKPEKLFKTVVCSEFKDTDLKHVKSKFFGYAKGAFPGANRDYMGMLAEANGGTLYLDEIGDIPYDVQRLLINALVTKVYTPLNSNKEIQSEFQLICATNRNKEEMVETNHLVKEFTTRFTVFEFNIPPLRERLDDIPVIVEDLLETADYQGFELKEMTLKTVIRLLRKSRLDRNELDIVRILDKLFFISQKPNPHSITVNEVIKYFEENKEPTRDDDFEDAVRQSLFHWEQTNHADRGKKWRDTFVDVAVQILSERPEYKKSDGELNIRRLSQMIGIDPKTINDRLDQKTF